MSRPHTPGSDSELRSLLEQIAATAGDPPEHGLDRVTTLRRRRTRHRRRAVATTMALAVSGVATFTWMNLSGQEDHDLSVASESGGDRSPTEPPDVLEVHCNPDGIEIPVATIQPETDGLHVHAFNEGDEAVVVGVVAELEGWESGPVEIGPGDDDDFVQPVAPGALAIECQPADHPENGAPDRRQVFLVDHDQLYSEPTLSCPTTARSSIEEALPESEETNDHAAVVEAALADYWVDETDEVAALEAYPDQTFGHPTLHPDVQVLRDDESVAFVRLEGDGEGPWRSVAEVTACDSFLVDPEPEEDEEPQDEDENPEGSDDEGSDEDEDGETGDERPSAAS